ncbi:hypothetical protein GCM10023322_28360 [Rugosimonospora acidiphila]|uniref:SseB protein N-terminal domain-containing protein n=1 Tax=Rugosimonospora acidiphila TaxID=556531 RepID=A0ABP9RT34_9ACTN
MGVTRPGAPVPVGDWRPVTEAEVAMAAAVDAGDREAYLRALAGAALVLPVSADAAAGRAPVTWATSVAHGTTYVVAFTSVPALPPGAPAVVRRSPLFDVARDIGQRQWGLAVDPGLPIQGFLSPDAVAELPGREPDWAPVDAALRAAVKADDRRAYLAALLTARLVLPLPAEGEAGTGPQAEPPQEPPAPPGGYWTAVRTDPPAPVSHDPTDPDFPWWLAERTDGVRVILAFTSPARMQAELGDREWVEPSFVELVAAWPDWGYGLRLNPGTQAGVELPGEALRRIHETFADAARDRDGAASG